MKTSENYVVTKGTYGVRDIGIFHYNYYPVSDLSKMASSRESSVSQAISISDVHIYVQCVCICSDCGLCAKPRVST